MTLASRTRRSLLALGLALPLAAFAFPDQPIEWVVPYPAGGGTDVVARTVAAEMSKTLKQPIIILNKPGAATNIGADYVARAKPDGYVVLTGDTATLAANPWLYSKLTYSAEKDFAPVGLLARFPMFLVVHPSVPAKNLQEFLAWVKAQPHPVNYGTPGTGSPHHLATELFAQATGVKLAHVPYKGAAPALQDVLGGQIPFMFVDSAGGAPHIASGKVRALGVASPARVASFADVPTLSEQGVKNFEAYAWQGMVVPAKTPQETINTLNKALVQALGSAPVQERFKALGLEAIPSTPAEMGAYAKSEREKWGKVIRTGGIKLD